MNHMSRLWRGVVCLLAATVLGACGSVTPITPEPKSPPPIIETQVPVPQQIDSDQDSLSDDCELNQSLTNPHLPDTDGDGLKDGQEVNQYKTSPLLADTDGDGFSDSEEIRNGGTNPLLADLPQLSIELSGNPSIDVNYMVKAIRSSKTIELVENKEKTEDSKSAKTNLSIENNTKLHAEVEASTEKKGWPPSASAKLTTDFTFSAGYFQNTSSNWEQSSVQNMQTQYETLNTETTEYSEGKFSAAMRVTNSSHMSVRLKNLVVNVYQPDKTLIGSIKSSSTWLEEGALLKPGGSITMILENDKIPAEKVENILRNPTGLFFEVASYEMFMVNDAGTPGTNFDILAQQVSRQSGMISIDYGEGILERYFVATNVERHPDGSSRGISLDQVLDVVGVEHEFCKQKDAKGSATGTVVLCNLENRQSQNPQNNASGQNGSAFWTVGGTSAQFGAGNISDYGQILLKPRQSIYLVYFRDSDGDQIFDSEEYIYGTDKDRADTDGDGLTDYQELKEGWEVKLSNSNKIPYAVYSDPLSVNSDKDNWNDKEESINKTDPQKTDTDGDLARDNIDPEPLSACLKNPQDLGLVAWWQAVPDETNVKDIWAKDGLQDGVWVHNNKPSTSFIDKVRYFSMNPDANINNQYIKVNNDNLLSLTGKKDFAIAMDMIWGGTMASGASEATLVSKGSTFALHITENGALTFTLNRHVNIDCWYACFDKQDDIEEKLDTSEGVIMKNQPYSILATFADDYMRIYVDGILKAEYYTPNERRLADFPHYMNRDDFMYLLTNRDPFVIGNTLEGRSPFKGEITNIQFYNAKVIPDDAVKLYQNGLCSP